jgi:metacaspase-1
MTQRIVWVHGIGQHQPGYSAPWVAVFNPFFNLPADDYIEVCWDTVFTGASAPTIGGDPELGLILRDAKLTERQQAQAAAIKAELTTILQARADALRPRTDTAGAPDAILGTVAVAASLEWSDRFGVTAAAPAFGLPDWLTNPDAYLGDFIKYLVSARVRNAVKEKAKEKLRPLAGTGDRCALITHSWGTVVAYDALLDLATETPNLQIADFITLGSPLWLVRRLLQDSSGRKPAQTTTWINIHAERDPVGSYLRPAFAVDNDYLVPTIGSDPHGSYFVDGNTLVQHDIIAVAVLG